jgi:RNA-directed DNA polymerase
MKRTARKKLQQSERRMKIWIQANRHLPERQFIEELKRKLVRHYNYFGLRRHEKALGRFYSFCIECAFEWGSTGEAESAAASTGPSSRRR